jgi:hypothetical protein
MKKLDRLRSEHKTWNANQRAKEDIEVTFFGFLMGKLFTKIFTL